MFISRLGREINEGQASPMKARLLSSFPPPHRTLSPSQGHLGRGPMSLIFMSSELVLVSLLNKLMWNECVVLVSDAQQSDSVLCIHIHTFPDSFPL